MAKRRSRKSPRTQQRTTTLPKLKSFREVLATFREVHKEGLRALRARDFKGLSHVIAVEGDLIQAQRQLIQKQMDAMKNRPSAARRKPRKST